ncbi:molybdopterin molybdotransferase MoeA [Bacillus tianshenii]|nr:molybdopterin molybdotransferase MoeA [Bacillus tianshenii]
MISRRKPIPVSEAIEKVVQTVRATGTEDIPLDEAYGRTLAEPIIATHNVPPFNRSPYDGFAIRSVDSEGASSSNRVTFKVIDHIGAGDVSSQWLQANEAVRIMTGAQIPENADAVVMFEVTKEEERSDGQYFSIQKPFKKNENVSMQGEDAKKGEVLIEEGAYIHPGVIALLATFGYAKVEVSKIPTVGVFATGSELVEVDEPLEPGKIRNSNGAMIRAQLKRTGVRVLDFGKLHDDEDLCFTQVQSALDKVDALITTGGVSVGDYDYLPAIYERLNADVLFNKIAMRPGSVTTVAHVEGKLLFGLSGNPSACFVGFELYARTALLKMMQASKPYLPYQKATLLEDFKKANPFTRFIRAIYWADEQGQYVVPAGFNKSNAVSSLARSNAFIVLPSGTRGFVKGNEVDVLMLGIEEGSAVWQL